MERLNRTDRKILDVLQRDGRLSNQEVASRVSLSPSATLRRIRALEAAGVIRRYVALVEPRKVGLGLMDSLLKHPGVLDVKSSFVLEEVKETTALPLSQLGN
jgi:DNA-binding Lrp family transcriptional regulator